MHINEFSLRQYIHNSWTYYQANDEYYTGQLDLISVFSKHENGKRYYDVHAQFVMHRMRYNVHFTVDQQGMIQSTRCSCKNNIEDAGCIHLIKAVRVINELNPQIFPFRIHYQDYLKEKERQLELEIAREQMESDNKELINLLNTMQDRKNATLLSKNEDSIHMHINLEKGYETSLSFNIGCHKLYRIKDIKTIIQGFANQSIYPLGKSNSIVLKKELLDEYSQNILDFLTAYAFKYEWKRDAILANDILDDAFTMLRSLPTDYYDFYLFEEKIKFPFILEKKEDYYQLKIDHKNIEDTIRFGKKHLYKLENRDFIRYNLDEQGQVGSLVQFIQERGSVLIKEENMKPFYLRMIKPNLEYMDIDTNFDLSVYESDVSDITIYSDLQDGELRVWGDYIQDGMEKKLFDESVIPSILSIESIISNYANTIKDNVAFFRTRGARVDGFLDQGIPLLLEQARVYVSDELMALKNRRNLNLSFGVQLHNHLLEIDIDTKDVSKDELIHILNAYRKKKKFYRLKNGDVIDLEGKSIQQLNDLTEQLDISTKELKKDELLKPAYQTLHLEDMDFEIHKDEAIQKYSQRLDSIQTNEVQILDKYKEVIRPYQKEGIEWIHHLNKMELNGILADDMGLGKTLQVLVYLESHQTDLPVLIVCPSSLMYNWQSEIKKFNIQIDYVCVTGNQKEREDIISKPHALYITTYDYLKRDIKCYQNQTFEYVILDEAQYIKNPKTLNAQSVKSLSSNHRLALTGTPIENSLTELWSIFDFLMPGYLYTLSHFVKTFEKPIRQDKNEKRQEQLQRLVDPFILRRTKAQVLTDLPDKVEKEMWMDFSSDEKHMYLANLARANEEIQKQLKLEQVDSILILSLMTRLRQICCEPRMLYRELEQASTKLSMCVNLIETLKENNKKVLLFSSFTTIFDLLIEQFKEKGIKYHILTGQTNKEKRQQEVEAFQNDDSDVFLISLKAGGTGLNLTAAQAVIHFDPWWNISAQNQATDRAYRIGQTKNVLVYQLLMKNSIEEKIFEMQKRKKEMSDIFVDGAKGGISSLSKEELKDLFSIK